MAKTVYNKEVISLQDDTEVTLAPLPIGRLKKFMKHWDRFQTEAQDGKAVESDVAFDIYVCAAGVSLSSQFEDRFENNVNAVGELSDDYKSYLEDVLDVDTATKILEVCGGLDLSSPKLEELVERAQAAAAEAGNN